MLDSDTRALDTAISSFESTAFNFSLRLIPDATARRQYNQRAISYSKDLVEQVKKGSLSASDAAKQASEMRNVIMEATRGKTSEIARAYAVRQKAVGKTLPELESKYAKKIFSKEFVSLSQNAKNKVWKEIVLASGRPQEKVNKIAKISGLAGRGLIFVTITVATYNIITADDKIKAASREGAVIGGGLLGSVAGGAAAGLACGPGAPVCVGIGIFIGGVMFAVGTDIAFDEFWR